MQLIVSVKKLNKRSSVPLTLTENNIIGTVQQGFRFEGEEVIDLPVSTLGKWYKDGNGNFYWGGGLSIEPPKIISNITDLPINLPQNYRLGIDVSHHNVNPDWTSIVNAGASFVFIKTSEGVGTPDNKAKENAENAKSKGLKIGYYHFCRPDKRNGGTIKNDAIAEAQDALGRINSLQKPDLPLILDLENEISWDTPLSKVEYQEWINEFLNEIKTKSDFETMIYSRKEYLDRNLPENHNLGAVKLWISYYPEKRDCNKVPCPVGWNDWSIWQYTETGVIGTVEKLDLNILKDGSLL